MILVELRKKTFLASPRIYKFKNLPMDFGGQGLMTLKLLIQTPKKKIPFNNSDDFC